MLKHVIEARAPLIAFVGKHFFFPEVWFSPEFYEDKASKKAHFWKTVYVYVKEMWALSVDELVWMRTSVHVWHIFNFSCTNISQRLSCSASRNNLTDWTKPQWTRPEKCMQAVLPVLGLNAGFLRPYKMYFSKDTTYKCIYFFRKWKNVMCWFPKYFAPNWFGCCWCI